MKIELLDTYQQQAATTAIFPEHVAFSYLPLKLAGEAGEVAEKFGKLFRKYGAVDDIVIAENREAIAKELGDVLWYIAVLATYMNYDLSQIAEMNLDKLFDRKDRGVLEGNGDNR